ncbi:MAG: 4Fe-4S dicluster domain-containing protein, partial [Eggerthellaceae bacterium]
MARYGMLIDTTKCIGCYACRTACQRQNDLLPAESFIKFHEFERGTYPHVTIEHVPTQCKHCDDSPCQAVSPTGATYTTEDGIVCVDHGRCIGCKYCMAACPYQARVVNEETGAVDKCRFCTVSA